MPQCGRRRGARARPGRWGPVPTDLQSPVMLLDGPQVIVCAGWQCGEALLSLLGEGDAHLLVQARVVVLEGEHVVVPHATIAAAMAVWQPIASLVTVVPARYSSDLIGLLGRRDLPGPACPRHAQRLTVDRHDLPGGAWDYRLDPRQVAGLEGLGVQRGEDHRQGVVAGDATRHR